MWASPLILLKPTFAPFVLIGIGQRAWWIGSGVMVGASLLLMPMWPDYIKVLRNNIGSWPGLLYSVPDYLFVLIPIVADVFSWRNHRRGPRLTRR